jgi:hypothetical protein
MTGAETPESEQYQRIWIGDSRPNFSEHILYIVVCADVFYHSCMDCFFGLQGLRGSGPIGSLHV